MVLPADTETDDQYQFMLKAISQNAVETMPEGSVDGVVYEERKGPGIVRFGGFTFPANKSEEYIYEISEVDPGSAAIYDYDKTVYRIYVTTESGNIVGEKVFVNGKEIGDARDEDDTFKFTNIYPLSVPVTPVVHKRIVGEKPNESDAFHFTLEANGNTAGLTNNPMPDGMKGSSKTIEVKSGGQTEFEGNFGVIEFSEPGEYRYRVYEVQEHLDRYDYDEEVYDVIWTVSYDPENNELSAEMHIEVGEGYEDVEDEKSGKLTFENVKLPEPPSANPEVEKFVGGGAPQYDSMFRFLIKGVSKPESVEVMPMPNDSKEETEDIEIKGTGHHLFGNIKFPNDVDGDYVYEIWEDTKVCDSENYACDPTVYTVTYTVTGKDVKQKTQRCVPDEDGKRNCTTVTETKKDTIVVDEYTLRFENTYLHGTGTARPEVQKLIKGNPNRDDVFTFRLEAVRGKSKTGKYIPVKDLPMPHGAIDGKIMLKISGAHKDHFGSISFDTPGEFIYEIREIKGDADYRYDETIYTVTYDVSENDAKDGTTVKLKSVMDGGKPMTLTEGKYLFTFTNKWGSDDDDEEGGGGEGGSGGSSGVLPRTGFAPGVVTKLPKQRVDYSAYSQLRLRVPALGINAEILGVPRTEGDWDVSWLGDNVGWLQNTAWPATSKAGNAVLTGHSYNYLGAPGVFANLDRLGYGAMITVSAYGENYIYMVEDVETVYADTPRVMSQKTDVPLLTLITCKYYNAATGQYDGRVVVKAKLVEIQ